MSSFIAKYSKILSIGLFIFGASSGANAACYALPQWTLKTAMLDIGKLNIPLTSKVGDILYKKSDNPFIPHQTPFTCKSGGGSVSFRITKDYGLAPGFQKVYTTDVPGVGVRFAWKYFNGGGITVPTTHYFGEGSRTVPATSGFTIEIVKIADKT
ncbi:hypothetical protein, partial [Pseudomonas sp. KCJK8993]|uniref:hypothetical protein n=1 Tax=Pseudomonas sp. KCJK8993 TaxID=3344565 RepID=UPI003905D4D1